MTILVAPDSFKGSLTAEEAAAAIARGVRQALPRARIDLLPLADGGEGTVRAVVASSGGRIVRVRVAGPLGRPVSVALGLLDGGRTAVVEVAQAAGLTLVPPRSRNPLRTTTRGVGDLILRALDRGCSKIVVGLGGSATVDGGAGMAQALGYRLADDSGREIPPGGGGLSRLAVIDASHADPRLRRAAILVACDVTNPLCGPRGAAAVFGPQKGATPAMVRRLDAGLARLARIIRRDLGRDIARLPGAGAAGGLGAALVAFCGARLVRGIDLVLKTAGFDDRLRRADLVVTGEGTIDEQTLYGKAVLGVAHAARRRRVPVVALAGRVTASPGTLAALRRAGVTQVIQIAPPDVSEREAFRRAPALLVSAAGLLMRTYGIGP